MIADIPSRRLMPEALAATSAILNGESLADLLAHVVPVDRPARISWTFRVLHHLPEPLDGGIADSVMYEERGGGVGKDAQIVVLGDDDLIGGRLPTEESPKRECQPWARGVHQRAGYFGLGDAEQPIRIRRTLPRTKTTEREHDRQEQ